MFSFHGRKLLPPPNRGSRRGCHARRRGFTLIELLVVIAIIAILSVVVILTLNPAELLRQSRDSGRVADMGTLTTALGIFSEDQSTGFLGSANTIYVSIPDPTATSTAGDQCQGLGLPTLPSTYSYHCAASSTYRNINGNGWIPVNFSSISVGSPLGSLPIDPLNTSSTRNYYTYTTNGTQYELTAPMESQKYKLGGSNDVIGSDGSTLSTVYAKGSNLSLEPLDYGDTSLVGFWPLTEGTGTVAYDDSGNNATGTWGGTQTGTSGYYSPGNIGPWTGTFDGSTDYINTVPINFSFSNPSSQSLTFSLWVNMPSCGASYYFMTWGGNTILRMTNCKLGFVVGGGANVQNHGIQISTNAWQFLTGVSSNGFVSVYQDGALVATGSAGASSISGGISFSSGFYVVGLMDDIRIYSRALSASEIAVMYSSGK